MFIAFQQHTVFSEIRHHKTLNTFAFQGNITIDNRLVAIFETGNTG